MEPQRDGWRERSLERSLRASRELALVRSERFIAAATELLQESGSLDFTVSELVARSGLSLRSFYQHFASKDDLLLAVLEEAIRAYVERLRELVGAVADPMEKLRVYVTGFYDAGESSDRRASAALSRLMMTLAAEEPSSGRVARVLEPQVQLLSEIVAAGVGAGRFRDDIPAPALTILLTQTLMSAVEVNVLGTEITGHPVGAAELWRFCRGAVSPPA